MGCDGTFHGCTGGDIVRVIILGQHGRTTTLQLGLVSKWSVVRFIASVGILTDGHKGTDCYKQ
jgi:hypothetical protein